MSHDDFDRISTRIYQGGAVDPEHNYPHFSLIVLCASEYQPALPAFRGRVVLAPMLDGPLERPARDLAKRVAARVAYEVQGGGRALVTCSAGMNRSGLVAGLALCHLTDLTADQIVHMIRVTRRAAAKRIGYPRALHNDDFVRAIQAHRQALSPGQPPVRPPAARPPGHILG